MLEIQIPDEIFNNMNISSTRKQEFVLEAVKEKIEREKENNFKALLIEGYQNTFQEDLALTKEYEHVDLENL